jgi:predicted sugar kinase
MVVILREAKRRCRIHAVAAGSRLLPLQAGRADGGVGAATCRPKIKPHAKQGEDLRLRVK